MKRGIVQILEYLLIFAIFVAGSFALLKWYNKYIDSSMKVFEVEEKASKQLISFKNTVEKVRLLSNGTEYLVKLESDEILCNNSIISLKFKGIPCESVNSKTFQNSLKIGRLNLPFIVLNNNCFLADFNLDNVDELYCKGNLGSVNGNYPTLIFYVTSVNPNTNEIKLVFLGEGKEEGIYKTCILGSFIVVSYINGLQCNFKCYNECDIRIYKNNGIFAKIR